MVRRPVSCKLAASPHRVVVLRMLQMWDIKRSDWSSWLSEIEKRSAIASTEQMHDTIRY